MSLKIFNADEVTMAFGPVLIESGFADGEFCRIEQEADDVLDVVGTDGEVAASRSNDRRATVTFVLMQTASANDGLSVLSNLAKTAPGMAGGVYPLLIKDRNGRAIYEAQNAWIMKAPDVSYDRTATSREWTVRCANLVRVDGGN